MGKTLAEYAAQHPATEPPADTGARSYFEWQEGNKRTEELKQSILQQLPELL